MATQDVLYWCFGRPLLRSPGEISRFGIDVSILNYWPLGLAAGWACAVAAEIASRRIRSSTGLWRKAEAPPAMARSRACGKSWPVTMMTGSAAHFRARDACTLNPSICGMCRSRTTQSGRRVSSDCKNSGPEANVSTLRPTERINRISALRIGSSSSTTATCGWVLVTTARQ